MGKDVPIMPPCARVFCLCCGREHRNGDPTCPRFHGDQPLPLIKTPSERVECGQFVEFHDDGIRPARLVELRVALEQHPRSCDVCGDDRDLHELHFTIDDHQLCCRCVSGMLATTRGAELIAETIAEADARLRGGTPVVVDSDEWLQPAAWPTLGIIAFWVLLPVALLAAGLYLWITQGA